jgi:hypothetical protein
MIRQPLTTVLPVTPKGGTEVSTAEDQGPVDDIRSLHLPVVCGLALVVGVITGLGAVMFRALTGFVHNLLFLGQLSITYDPNLLPPSPWGPWVILVPVLGGDRRELYRQHLRARGNGPRRTFRDSNRHCDFRRTAVLRRQPGVSPKNPSPTKLTEATGCIRGERLRE